jgi:hypothetical protein
MCCIDAVCGGTVAPALWSETPRARINTIQIEPPFYNTIRFANQKLVEMLQPTILSCSETFKLVCKSSMGMEIRT